MKKAAYILFFLFSFANVFSQANSLGVYTIVDEMPLYPGGSSEMIKFIMDNASMPKKSKGGKAFIKFVIDVDGKVKDIRVLKSSGDELLDKEAMRVIEIMPPWTPGKQNGKPVPVYFNLPINFKV